MTLFLPHYCHFQAIYGSIKISAYFHVQVITAQYFVWFFCLLPLILPWSIMKLKWKGLACIILWIGAQTHWLMWGYLLEFRGKNVFFHLWVACLLFLAANTFVIINTIRSHLYCPLFKQLKPASKFKQKL